GTGRFIEPDPDRQPPIDMRPPRRLRVAGSERTVVVPQLKLGGRWGDGGHLVAATSADADPRVAEHTVADVDPGAIDQDLDAGLDLAGHAATCTGRPLTSQRSSPVRSARLSAPNRAPSPDTTSFTPVCAGGGMVISTGAGAAAGAAGPTDN